ncbi:alpha/beta hydrolase [Bacillus sp. 2205SS5-2]|uniref:alpha/beta hydrolase n=1 Tax=Bacillus sp. 2205SS5-2 TaxID=3109031 RepID=UPI0030043E47
MNESVGYLRTGDGNELFTVEWKEEDRQPKAVIQLAHGMAEHIMRYQEFSEYLVKRGIFVIGHDHRGHGRTAEKNGSVGYFSDEEGFERVVDDLHEVNAFVRSQYHGVPLFLFGHSMGSFIVRRYIQRYSEPLQGVILSGTGDYSPFMGRAGKLIANRIGKKKGMKTASSLLDKLSFGKFNQNFSPANTPFDWLSRDEEAVQDYIVDPYCGRVSSAGMFIDLLTGLSRIHDENEVKKIPRDVPFLFISGDQDPVGRGTKGVQKVINQMQRYSEYDIVSRFYSDGRHEMLNEINREEVFQDIVYWIENRLNQSNK